MPNLEVYAVHRHANIPKFSTTEAACFDLEFQILDKRTYKGFTSSNKPFEREFGPRGVIVLAPGDRVLVPTGIIFKIPEKHSVRIHARSGLSLKKGLVLANAEGVIDSDYHHETFVLMTNISNSNLEIVNGDRVAQGELVKSESYKIVQIKEAPGQTTNREGGFGSTGVSTDPTEEIVVNKPVPQGELVETSLEPPPPELDLSGKVPTKVTKKVK